MPQFDQTQYQVGMDVDANGYPIPKVSAQLTGSNAVKMLGSDGVSSPLVTNFSGNDGQATGNNLSTAAFGFMHNGINWDRVRNNSQGTLAASQARTASTVCPTQTNYNAKGVIIFLNVTAASGTGGLSIRIRGISPAGMPHYLNISPAAITTTGSKVFEIYPGSNGAGSSDVAQRTSAALPRTWTVEITHGDSSSYTYQLDYALIL